jgi:NTP pyrophosphatase (non-canonical NTP hydrolase)
MDDDAPLTLDDLTERVEAISALYARKFAVERDPDWFMLKLAEEVGELTQAFLVATGRTRPRGDALPSGAAAPGAEAGSDGGASPLADEVADVLAHLLLLARSQGVDVDAAVRRKWLVWEAELSGRSPRR